MNNELFGIKCTCGKKTWKGVHEGDCKLNDDRAEPASPYVGTTYDDLLVVFKKPASTRKCKCCAEIVASDSWFFCTKHKLRESDNGDLTYC